MANVQLLMPEMGESVTEGTVLEWHVAEGDAVEEGQTMVEVSTDKVDAEVPAPADGTVSKILVGPDETIEVGGPLAEISPNGAAASAEADSTGNGSRVATPDAPAPGTPAGEAEEVGGHGEADAPSGQPVEITMPEMGESVTEGTVLEWLVAEGDVVEEGQTVVEVSTDKVDAEVPAPTNGTITKILVGPDETIEVGKPLGEMARGAAPSGSPSSPRAPTSTAPSPGTPSDGGQPTSTRGSRREDVPGNMRDVADDEAADGGALATPVAKRAARANGVSLGAVKGSGAGGKVTKADVLTAASGDGSKAAAASASSGEVRPLRGPAGTLAKLMEESLQIPTATSFRTLAVDTLDAKRKALNGVLKERGMKVSFTHLIAWAIVLAAREWPVMARHFERIEGKPNLVEPGAINLGIAVDVERKGQRSLMVPCIKGAEGLDFRGFHAYYEELITKTRENKLTADDFQGTNITLTNPGGLGTVASVPRLMAGQGTIIACGSLAYPVEWRHVPADKVKALGVSKVMTVTSTYDHRIIQGAESGSFLRRIDQLLQGEDDFYERVAQALDIPTNLVTNAHAASASAPPLSGLGAPAAPSAVVSTEPDREIMQAVQAGTSLLKAYRTHGHLAAAVNPLGGDPKGDPALEPENLNLTPDLMARIPAEILRIGVEGETLLEVLPRMRDAYCSTIAYQIEHLSSHQQRMWLREMIETGWHRAPLGPDEKRALLSRLLEVFQFERFLQKAYLGQKMFSIEGLDVTVPMLDEIATLARQNGADEVVIGMAHRGRLAVLVNNLGRSVESILAEFEGAKALDRVKAIAALPRMRDAYCGTIAYQIEHLSSHQQRMWLREMIETGAHRQPLAGEEKRQLLSRLVEVFQFERFLQKAYLG
ncbi:MAG: 2-oxo acid dehydrogenase subunit E2, partial [Solirubrobacterales bacterium]